MPQTIDELYDYIVDSACLDKHNPIWKERWYSDKEVDKIIQQCLNTKIHIEDFKNTGIIKCPMCYKDFIKINAYNWKPDCSCFKNKNLRLSVG